MKEVKELAVFLQSVEGLNPWLKDDKDGRRVETVEKLVSAAFGSSAVCPANDWKARLAAPQKEYPGLVC